ncbi:MAG: peptidoglycan recognition family protein [Pyrinomonadaceae bacterium]
MFKVGDNTKIRGVFFWLLVFVFALSLGTVTIVAVMSFRNTIDPKGIVIHHSAVPYRNGVELDARQLNEIHRRRGFGILCSGKMYYIGYHYVILPDGALQQGRPENCEGAHTAGYNDYLGICLIGDFSLEDNPDGTKGPQNPTTSQLNTLENLIRNMRLRHGIVKENIKTHRDLNPGTECPGDNFPKSDLLDRIKD